MMRIVSSMFWSLLLASSILLVVANNTVQVPDSSSSGRLPRQDVSEETSGNDASSASKESYLPMVTETTPVIVNATNNNTTPEESDLPMVTETLQLIEEGEKFVQLPEGQDVVFVLGNTGSGKSTLIQFLPTDNKNLVAYEKGTVDFLIKGANDKISTKTDQSKTIYPELIWSNDRKTACIDCPGFSDTRNASFDIAGTYLIKEAIYKAHRVKLIFTVSYSSVLSGENRHDFPILLNHASKLVKNIDNFNNSIGLVVTKVNRNYIELDDGTEVPENDTQTKSNIVMFLREVKESLKTKVPGTAEDELLLARQIRLIDIFTSMEGNEYTKLEIFRRPNKVGPLSESSLLQNGKKNIEKLVQESTEYVSKSADDFGFTISDNAKLKVIVLINEIDRNVVRNVSGMAVSIKEHFQRQESITRPDTLELQDLFEQASNFISPLLLASSNSSEIISKLDNFIHTNNISIPGLSLYTILKNIKYAEFLQAVSDKDLEFRSLHLTVQFNDIYDYVRCSKNWYDFLIKLQSKLSEYKVQKDTGRYNVADLSDWGMSGKPQGIQITSNNLQQFLDHCSSSFLIRYNDNVDVVKDDSTNTKLSVLNTILKYMLKNRVEITQEGKKLIARGHFIKLKDVSKELAKKEVKRVEIYAANTVFIDADIMLIGREINVYILAEKWVVVGTRRIVSDGKDGEVHAKAMSGSGYGGHGSNGTAGNPGGPSGNFFGVGIEFIDGNQLTVTVNGGNGGPGQDGGDGAVGRDGTRPPDPPKSWTDTRVAYLNSEVRNYYTGWTLSESGDGSLSCSTANATTVCRSSTDFIASDIDGIAGGVGGSGYRSGRIEITSIKDLTGIITSSEHGATGRRGRGGKAGQAGQPGCTVKFNVLIHVRFFLFGPLTKHTVYPRPNECNEIIPPKEGDSKAHPVPLNKRRNTSLRFEFFQRG